MEEMEPAIGTETELKIMETCKISPSSSTSSSSSSSNFTLPLSSYDWIFVNIPPTKRVLFYSFTESESESFFESVVSKLKLSLSLTLEHFLPLAGNLVWPENSIKPFILYTPNDGVSFTVAESSQPPDHFSLVSGNEACKIKDLVSLIPEIQGSETESPLTAIQVTKFKEKGFSIGMTFHHVLYDGKSISLFLKAWAYFCKLNIQLELESRPSSDSLPEELIPSFDRTSNHLLQTPFDFIPKAKNLKYLQHNLPSNWLQGTFELTPTHIQKLKNIVVESIKLRDQVDGEVHLSTFAVSYAYAISVLMKAKAKQVEKAEEILKFCIHVTVDLRRVLDPPISNNYFGNCLKLISVFSDSSEIIGKDYNELLSDDVVVFLNIFKKISDVILKFKMDSKNKNSGVRDSPKPIEIPEKNEFVGVEFCSVSSSPKFKYYEASDFGWGKPKKFEIIAAGNYHLVLMDTKNGDGGIQLTLALPAHLMDLFTSLFF